MNTIDFNPTDTFDASWELYYRDELVERYDYLIEATKAMEPTSENAQAWIDAHRKELATLQHLLYKVPEPKDGCLTHIVAERYIQEYCTNLLNAFICCDADSYLYKYFDVDAMAKRLANDMPRIEINGAIYFISVRDDV